MNSALRHPKADGRIPVQNCPECGAELSSGEHAGLCPRCLIKGALNETSLWGSDADADPTILAPRANVEDDVFGPYQILRVLGEGGMGTVYLAEQREPIRRSVALKVVKLGMDTDQVLARFNNERQALAILDHSNIACIFDAGATSHGRPYFVMEYIDGLSITEYCDRRMLTTRERLDLFLPVCRAVQYAHQKGLIHRDLKPSNVLVTEQDERPVPKVIDFGIAKATDRWALDNTLYTNFGQMVGTPEYASPEQADLIAGEIGAGSDVYSLGVLLYELLIGAVPFDSGVLRKSGLAEMLRIVREEQPPTLPGKLTAMGQSATDIAIRRGTDPATLRRLVEGDLNWITMKALEKKPDRRYASVSDLAADVERHLADHPVLAGPPGKAYRVSKFIRRHKPVVSAAAGVVLVLLGGGTVWSFSDRVNSRKQSKLSDTDTILLGDFANKTGDSVFDETLRQGLAAQLEQSPFLSLLSEERIADALRLAGQPADARLTPELAREVCERTGGGAIVEGSISTLGVQYVLGLQARSCRTGDVLDRQQAQAAGKEDVLNTLSQMASRFRSRAGESLATIEKHSTPLPEATTPSMEALKSYSAALSTIRANSFADAVPRLKRAIEIDPQFAMAHAYLGRVYSDLGEAEPAAASTRKAYELRDRVSDRENVFIMYNYYRQVTRNLELARQTCESWAQRYPRESSPHGFLAGFTSQGSGLYEKSIEEGTKAIGMDSGFVIGYADIAWSYVFLNRLPEAEAIIARESAAGKTDMPDFTILRYFIAFLRGDQAGMDREASARQGKSGDPAWIAQQESLVLAYQGRQTQARTLSRQAVDLARQARQPERAAIFEGGAAVREAMFGNRVAARKQAAAALQLSRGRDADYGPAFALALSGDSAAAQKIANELEEQYPEDTSVRFQYLPALRGLLALKAGNATKAIELTQAAMPYELAVPGTNFYAFFGSLYATYVRGLAYVAARRYSEADVEFRKILDNPGVVLADPVGAMARLEIGRLLRASGETDRARAAYKDFLRLWKAADPDIPILQQARAELVALR
jgi:eukaryotic-like serine/threonine-protein kinase